MVIMQAILQFDAENGDSHVECDTNGDGDIKCALVAAVAHVRPWTSANLQRMMRLADLLVYVSSARPSIARLLSSAVWDEACGQLLPLAGVGWGRGLLELAAALLCTRNPPFTAQDIRSRCQRGAAVAAVVLIRPHVACASRIALQRCRIL
jgi:hypothetical protein